MECIVHGVSKSQTRLSDFHLTHQIVKNWTSMTSSPKTSDGGRSNFDRPFEFGYTFHNPNFVVRKLFDGESWKILQRPI